jgi:hypothetical protein
MQRRSGDAAPYGRVFAALHLAALGLLLIGVVAATVIHGSWPLWALFPSAVVLWVQANLLGRRDPQLDGGRPRRGGLSNYQYAWYHLLFGQETARAWRVLCGT